MSIRCRLFGHRMEGFMLNHAGVTVYHCRRCRYRWWDVS